MGLHRDQDSLLHPHCNLLCWEIDVDESEDHRKHGPEPFPYSWPLLDEEAVLWHHGYSLEER